MTTKQKVKAILMAAGSIPKKELPTIKGCIDMKRFENIASTKAVIELFRLLGVDSEWLRTNGFMPAFMLYGQFLKGSKDKK